MREAGLSVARMAEFAWSTMEPEAGRFDLDWLADAVALLAENGIATVLGTPTAAPPAWLVQQHRDLLAVAIDGRRVQFGNRCHYCVTSPDLHQAARRIATAMAERFGRDPNVIGWQLDNEYNRVCHCDRCRDRFQRYLAERFGSLAALNAAWATRYWSQTYSAWEQIPLPVVQPGAPPTASHNPGLRLEFKRFVTDCYRRFQRCQVDALRPHLAPGAWITHNFMGWFEGLDHYLMTEDLDFASWDWYVGTGHHDYLTSGAAHDLTRGFKRRNFWVMETQVGHTNHTPINSALDKGEMRAMAWHAVAHGADALLYWQWRMAPGGQEQYWGTVVDQAGRPRPVYEELQRLGRDFAAAGPLLVATTPVSEVAILNSYDDRWAIHIHRHHQAFDYVAHLTSYYRPFAQRNIAADIVSVDAPLDGYKLVIAPALHLINEERSGRLREFVERGGHLVLTVRSGMKDDRNALLPARPPGPLAALAGIEVEDYYALLDPVPVAGAWLDGTARIWAERLTPLAGAKPRVLAHFGAANGWLDGQAAVTVFPCGRGLTYFVGAWLDDDAQQALIDRIVAGAGVAPVLETPAGVEARRRVDAQGKEVLLLINHARDERTVSLPWPGWEHLSEMEVGGELRLSSYGVAIITRAL
ncbi:MAG: beta-galactosidase [Chloroflexota bacterium]|nr:beta-galactosidase [Chloroflexota bacterium]